MIQEDVTLYNQVTVHNIDNEDFVFKVNREEYYIAAGDTKKFPKFMSRPLLKHLIDKILIKQDPEGKALRNKTLRDELALRIILDEETYQKPIIPTDREVVEKMNTPELDRVLQLRKDNLKNQTRRFVEDDEDDEPRPRAGRSLKAKSTLTGKLPKGKVSAIEKLRSAEKSKDERKEKAGIPTIAPGGEEGEEEEEENFDQINEEKGSSEIPSRAQMLSYAKKTLMLDVEDPTTKASWDAMDDEQLYEELGLNTEGAGTL